MANDSDITLLTIVRHMQAMEERIMQRFAQTDARIDRLETKVDHIKGYLLMQIDNMDKRLDGIEVVQLPAIRKAVGMV
ncbi:MAG: hypothetical protein PHZ00_04220 [Candidatus Peribacteraceae bacterium]|nr:hypothetical protein [Candidatus Peribacteraceae bacterium]